ncbi:MAG: VWA domain-containing protein [Actinomycetota bacterium]|nr:VWA domain-containing protein [Actinomycetota bacterium]
MLDVLAGFIGELRAAGLPVSLTEDIDSMDALRHVPLEDRTAFKHALAATLVKSHAHRKTFDAVFDIWFSPPLLYQDVETDDETELAEWLEQAMATEDGPSREAAVKAAAMRAVSRYAGMEEGRPVGGRYYLHRTLRHVDLDGIMQRLLAAGRQEADHELTELEELLLADEHRSRAERLRAEIEGEIRRRLVADRGPEALARTARAPLPEDVDFMHASAEDLAALRRTLQPLTRKLAARLGRRRRHNHRGSLHFGRTVRHSISYGGVPVELEYRHPHPSKPEILVIADISGSVASFSRFTLELVHAMSSQFSKVRSFVFVDGIDEVTRFFEGAEDLSDALRRINTEADVVWADGHSDYGRALEAFWQRWGSEVSPKTTVLVLGDARNNYHAAEAWVMAEIANVARHVYWLNPEPRSYWDTGDSIVDQYAVHCDGAFECRNLKQLAAFVDHLS